ncbi:MAG TPA: NfeD family protein [Lacunisphaera sp.]|jgi:membrane-bound serine protease (ClpP class)|nr:NfeD family protein [Lacunisphaera sp.]
MFRSPRALAVVFAVILPGLAAAEPAAAPPAPPPAQSEAGLAAKDSIPAGRKTVVYVIPVKSEINRPILYILRRGLKEADQKADAVVLDMDTPGGALDVTFDIMEALGKFHGETLTYVDKEAMSAGAFISATTGEIWFAPDAVIGAAAPVSAEGKDIDPTMKQKVVSYLKARVRAISEGKGYRGEVISAMIDADYELKIGDKVLKPKGELLSLTATEANRTYGDPPLPLLGAGVARDIDAMLTKKFGADHYTIRQFEVTWSEVLAQYLTKFSPVLLGLGLLALFIEFKTPGFGAFGIIGIVLLGIVFLGNYVAGFSGHEPLLVFAVGLLLLALELFFFPGVAVLALLGLILMLGSLVWAMADLWPGQPLTVAWSGDAFVRPIQNLGLGLVIAVGLGLLLARFMPKGWMWDKMVVASTSGGIAQRTGASPDSAGEIGALVGQRGVAATALRPSGQVEIAGRRFEAKVEVGAVYPGEAIIVRGRTDFALIVEKADA